MKKHILSYVLLFMLIMILAVSVHANGETSVITLETVNADPTAGTEIEVNVILENNPGMVSLTVPITWDDAVFSLIDVKNTEGVIPTWYGMTDLSGITDTYYIAWNNDTYPDGNFNGNGVLCTLVFQLKQDITSGKTEYITVDETDELLSIMNFDMQDYSRGEVEGTSFSYVNSAVTFTQEEGCTVSGTVTSYGSETDVITIQLIDESTSETVQETTVTGNNAQYCFTDVEPGTYIIRISKKNHVTREVKITVQ